MDVHNSKRLSFSNSFLESNRKWLQLANRRVYRSQSQYKEASGKEGDRELKSHTGPGSRMRFCFIHIFNHSSLYFKGESKVVAPHILIHETQPNWIRLDLFSFYAKFLEKRIQLGPKFGKEFPLSQQLRQWSPCVAFTHTFKSLPVFVT